MRVSPGRASGGRPSAVMLNRPSGVTAKKTPNTMAVVQFTSKDTFASGTETIKKAFPNAVVIQHYPLVIGATGPDKEANLAAVEKQLPPASS